MKKLAPGLLAGTAALALSITVLQPAEANPSVRSSHEGSAAVKSKKDNRPGPKTKQQQQRRAKALALLESGKAELVQRQEGATVALGDGTFAEFPIKKTDKVFTVLSEFGTSGSGKLGTTPGPLHNQIPAPDREVDNSTYWQADFSKAHYEEMFNGDGESFKDYYLEQSSGRYTAINTVSDWVKVPGNASSYGDNAVEDNGGTWAFVDDSLDAWYAQQVAAGKSRADHRGRAGAVRHVGPLRLGQRRQLQRSRRLHRPLPGRARRRGRGGRRGPGHDLVAPLVRQQTATAPPARPSAAR